MAHLKEAVLSRDPDETGNFASKFLNRLNLGAKIGLLGSLGAGKTTFIKAVAENLGITKIKSPTFVFHQPYLIKKGKFKGNFFHHFDFYRLSPNKPEGADIMTDLLNKNGLFFIEWPDNLPKLQEKLDWLIEFKIKGETQREIRVSSQDKRPR